MIGGGMKWTASSIFLVVTLVVPSRTSAADHAANTPQEVIASLYAHHQPGKNREIDLCDRAGVSRYCDPALTDLFVKDCECGKKRQEVCNLDWDPFYDAQDFDDSEPNPRIREVKPAGSFEVTLRNLGERKLIYEMKRTPEGWRISNIRSPSSKWSLREVLSGTQK